MHSAACPVRIGRDVEWRLLTSALQAAADGRGGLVVLTGEAGIGKTRLVNDLGASARSGGAPVLIGRATPGSTSDPFRPITEALLQGLRQRDISQIGALRPWLPLLRPLLPTMGSISAGEAPDSPAARGEAVLQLLGQLAEPAGVLLVLEDLHWADADTLAIVEYLCDNAAAAAVLCVATTRVAPPTPASQLVERLRTRRAGTHLALSRLDAGQVEAMVRVCAPDATSVVIERVQATADGVPFLVEEALAATGVPSFFTDGVAAQLASLAEADRTVVCAAALLGRRFDWHVLSAATSLDDGAVSEGLQHAADAQLLTIEDGTFVFRHVLTRDAVVAGISPTRRAEIARTVLDAVERARPELSGPWRDVAVELALTAGDQARAGGLLLISGREAIGRGALATAIDTLRRAANLLGDSKQGVDANRSLLDALALAGRLADAIEVSDFIRHSAPSVDATATATVHVRLAQAAVAATRWALARHQIELADEALGGNPEPALRSQLAVLDAEVAYADFDLDHARDLAEASLATKAATPEVRCQALELLGRIARGTDLAAATRSFESALASAEGAGLAVWRLRALHELGTVDMFDHAGTERLTHARRLAADIGAVSTGAVIDVQLAATALFRFELDTAERHAHAALELSTQLGLEKVRATALLFIAETCALRQHRHQAERFAALAEAAAPGDLEISGSALAGVTGLLALLDDDVDTAVDVLRRGIALLDRLPPTGPAHYRGLWPLLLATVADAEAADAIDRAARASLTVNRINRGFLGFANAILAGRAGHADRASALAEQAERDLRHYPVWSDLAGLFAAEPARTAGWGEPRRWLAAAASTFEAHGIDQLADRSRRLQSEPAVGRWTRLGVTDREADVLRLVRQGLSNRQIAAQLHVSPRTVEKHVEAMLRKTSTQSRTQLVALVGPEHDDSQARP